MASSPRVCVLVSGGIDSSVLMAEMLRRGYEVSPLYVRSGFIWERAELVWLKRLLRALRCPLLHPLTVIEVPMAPILGGHWSLSGRGVPATGSAWDSVYLPGRNLILLSQAAVFCAQRGIGLVALGVLKGNPFRDARLSFLAVMGKAASSALGARLRIIAPYRRLSKKAVLKRVPGFPIELAFSCLKPKGLRHCGVCNKCEERSWSSKG